MGWKELENKAKEYADREAKYHNIRASLEKAYHNGYAHGQADLLEQSRKMIEMDKLDHTPSPDDSSKGTTFNPLKDKLFP